MTSSATRRERFVGAPLRRREDVRVLRGQTRYVDDIDLPGLAYVAFVRSQYAHAGIESIQVPVDAARKPIAVLTAADLGEEVQPFPLPQMEGAEFAPEPHPILARDEVRYVGQPIAAVIAESRELAEDAAELVEVEYAPRDALVDPRKADTALMRWSRRSGDVERAFASAAYTVTGRYALPRVVAAPIEPRGCVVDHDPGRDHLTVRCSAQDPHRPLAQLAHILQRPRDSIRVIVPDVGGAFGSKGVIAPEVAAVAIAAIHLGRPLKWIENRYENFLAAYQGRGIEGELALALDPDGRMLAIRAHLLADLGAYLFPSTPIPPHTAANLLAGCYAIEVAEVTVRGALTHKVPTGPYRGAGRPDAAYLLERLVDDAARATGIDRIELRRRNLIRTFPHHTPIGYVYDSGDYERCLDLALELCATDDAAAAPDDGRVARGKGVALFVERAGGAWESAEVEARPDGTIAVRSSSSPHGQGHDTTFAQIAADRLGVPLEKVELRFGDSDEGPPGVGTFGSRSVAMAGSAVALAVDKLLERAREQSLPFEELLRTLTVPLRAAARFESDRVFSSGAYAAVVEIERATGRMRVRRLVAVDDAGTVINPLLAHGQVLGGVAQGLGECLLEEAVYDDVGQLRTASFVDYALLTAAETPGVVAGTVETPSPLNPLGAKGVGEGGAIGSLAAVANAVADALGRHVDPPFTSEKLWQVLM